MPWNLFFLVLLGCHWIIIDILLDLFGDGGVHLKKKDFISIAFIILCVITTIAVIREQDALDVMGGLHDDNDELTKRISDLEKEFEESSKLKKDYDNLKEKHALLEKEVDELKTSVNYEDFVEAISIIEAYKVVQSFRDVEEFLAWGPNIGMGTMDREGTCPCSLTFGQKGILWEPNAVLDLREFRHEKDKIILTYNTTEDIEKDYQFVMTKSAGWNDNKEKWKIAEIIQEEKVE